MKHIFTVLFTSLVILGSAQSPFLVNYQGVARDGLGNPLANQLIAIKFEVLQGSATGPVIYTDNQTGIQTNSLGLFSTQIGKAGGLGQVNFTGGGPYYLQVSMDANNGANLIVLGTQQIVSVPFAIHAETVPSTYTNNILTVGTKTHAINSGTPVTVQSTGTNVLVSPGPNYTVSYVPPALALNANSISIVGSNAVALPASITPTVTGTGIATSTNGASAYTVNVPPPTYNQVSGVLAFGTTTTLATPTLGMSGGILYSGPFSNSVAIPGAVTISGTGMATVTGGPAYLVNVPPPTLTLSSNNLSLSIVGSNSVAFPAGVTVAAPSGNIVNVTGGPTNYTVSVPNPAWTGTALTLGPSTTTIAPTLLFNPSTGALTSGVATNSVSLAGFGPFTQAGTSVTLTTVGNSVAIGSNAASAKLDVFSNTGGSVFKVNDAAASNASPAAEISSGGVKSLFVTNTSATGIAGDFSSTGGQALNAQNNSALFPTFQAQNINTSSTAYAGNFIGGLSASGNGSTSTSFAFKTVNSLSSNLFAVRNDGYIGIGNITPVAKLDIATGNLRVEGISGGAGKIFLGSVGGVDDGYTGIYRVTDNLVFSVFKLGGGSAFGSQSYDAVTIASTSGNVGIGTASPAQKLDVAGSVKITDGSEGLGKVLTSDASGNATWAFSTITTASVLAQQNIASVGTTQTAFPSALASFTKLNADSKIQVVVQAQLYVDDLSGNFGTTFEVKLTGAANATAAGNSGRVAYHFDNNSVFNTANFKSVTIIAEFIPGSLPAGLYNVTLSASVVAGTASGLYIDNGNWGTSSVVIKEYR